MHTPTLTPPTASPPPRGLTASARGLTAPSRGRSTAAPRGRTLGRRGKLALAGALALVTLLGTAGPAAAFTTQWAFTIAGHGWGHGVGMSQWGAYGYAKKGWKYDKILTHYYTGVTLKKYGNPTIRVNLRSGQSSIKLTCPSAYTVQGTGSASTIPGGTTATVTYVNDKYRVKAGSWSRDFGAVPTFSPTSSALRVVTKTDFGDTGAYRGTVKVRRTSGTKLMMVNHVALESYLRGVVPYEVPASWPAEAIKAQACAARSFAIRSRQGTSRDWDVYCDVRSQVYGGVDAEDSRTDKAVRDTAGVCPTAGGQPIQAFYFSSSGGRTENSEFVWSSAVSYLKSVSDPYDTYATRHNWGPIRKSSSQIGNALGVGGTVRAVYTVKKGKSPRIVRAAVITSSGLGKTKHVAGTTLRTELGLYSTWATFKSMSISPAARDKASIVKGYGIKLSGKVYPALAAGTKVTLHYKSGDAWKTLAVATTRASEQIPKIGDYPAFTAKYSTYSVGVKPAKTTQYYFSHGKAKSPTTTITVN